jgi:hypothetical protein
VKTEMAMQEKDNQRLQLPRNESLPIIVGQSSTKSPLASKRNSVAVPTNPAMKSASSIGKVKSVALLVEGKHAPHGGSSYFNFSNNVLHTSAVRVESDEEDEGAEDEDDALYGVAQGLGAHAPKKSAGRMSHISKNSGI